jgi:hypothetical protein
MRGVTARTTEDDHPLAGSGGRRRAALSWTRSRAGIDRSTEGLILLPSAAIGRHSAPGRVIASHRTAAAQYGPGKGSDTYEQCHAEQRDWLVSGCCQRTAADEALPALILLAWDARTEDQDWIYLAVTDLRTLIKPSERLGPSSAESPFAAEPGRGWTASSRWVATRSWPRCWCSRRPTGSDASYRSGR